jgi:SAM-dependent methyltransferase
VKDILADPTIASESVAIRELARSFRRTSLLVAGVQLGVFDALADGSQDVRTVAKRTKLDPRMAQGLLDGLVSLQLVTVADGRYAPSPAARRFLVSSSPTYYGHAILYPWYCQWPLDRDIVRLLRAGNWKGSAQGASKFRFDLVVEEMVPSSVSTGLAVCEVLGLEGREDELDILDVGGGSGVVGGVIALKCPGARVTQIDFPRVNRLARVRAKREGWSRNRYVDGDYFTVKLPRASYEIVILKSVCISESPERIKKLFQRAHGWLRPDGFVIVSEGLVGDDRAGPPGNLRYGSELLLSSPYGRNYTQSEFKGWLADAGFAVTPAGPLLLGQRTGA